ncbi:hypothetical protein AAG570_008501 [Ranatra chinensis]|uniref:protein-histidine N-methyltransferase n=1 Tax=Ranatra chinensis TaxID=642074 RepID=A0ABD0YR58_9HEMI
MPPRNDEFIDALTSWMENNGAVIKNMRISEFSNYDYGLKAIGDIKENDLLVVVPRKLMLTTEMANNSILGNLIKTDPLLQSMPNVTLAVFLLIERFNETSFWKPYIFMLPRVYQTVMWFTSDELSQLKGSPTFEPALKQCRNIARQYAYFYSLFQVRLKIL